MSVTRIIPQLTIKIEYSKITQDEYEKIRDILINNFQRKQDTSEFNPGLRRFNVFLDAEIMVGRFSNEYLKEISAKADKELNGD